LGFDQLADWFCVRFMLTVLEFTHRAGKRLWNSPVITDRLRSALSYRSLAKFEKDTM
jgi:hypothetical protein